MQQKGKNKINMGKARPSVKQDKYYVKNVVTPDTRRASEDIKRREERQKQRAKTKEKQKAKILGSSLWKKTGRNFSSKRSLFSSMSSTIKRRLGIALVAIVVLALGISIGIFAFIASTSARLSIDEVAKSKLVKVSENQPYFTLFAVDSDNDDKNDPDMLMLTRIDPVEKSFIIIQIPIDTYVAASYGGGGTTLKKIFSDNGDAGLIDAVATFTELGITHYVRSSADGISDLVDALGGIEVNLKEYVDDPKAGDIYIPQGNSTINGKQVLTLLSATNFSGGKTTISLNQREVCVGILKASLYKNLNIAFIVDKMAGSIKTDMGSNDIISFIDSFKDCEESNIKTTEIPGYKTMRSNIMVYMIDASAWKSLRMQINYGVVPETSADYTIDDINPGEVSIVIQNGAGIVGAAGQLAEALKNLGFNVLSTSNAENNVYQETLIIYNGEAHKKNAEVIKNSINNGRLVNGDGLYNMTSDILIIIGYDLKI